MIYNDILETVFNNLELNERDFTSSDIIFLGRRIDEMIKEKTEEAYNNGYSSGEDSVDDKYDEGHKDGYEEGYEDGYRTAEGNIKKIKENISNMNLQKCEYTEVQIEDVENLDKLLKADWTVVYVTKRHTNNLLILAKTVDLTHTLTPEEYIKISTYKKEYDSIRDRSKELDNECESCQLHSKGEKNVD